MKIRIVVILSSLIAFLFFAACGGKKKESEESNVSKQQQTTEMTQSEEDSLLSQWNYSDSSGRVTTIVFGEDGQVNYVVDLPENIFAKTKSGIEYRFVKRSKSEKMLSVGDVMYMNMSYKAEKNDSMLFSTKDIDEDFKMRLAAPKGEGCIEEALMLMHEGDSAIIKVDAIDFFLKSQGKTSIPAFIKKGDKIVFYIGLKKIVSGLEYANSNKELYRAHIEEENSLINRFLMDKKYPMKTTDSGLKILTIDNGAGKKPVVGNTVKIDYTAAFIDGAVFDSTLERSEPFSFVIGKKEVIVGLEEAVMNMKVGEHCLVVIPFRLAYGDQKYGNIIPPFSTLVFEIELLDAK